MKLLNLKPFINKIGTSVRNLKIEAKEKEICSLVNLEEVTQLDAYKQLYDAREVLANYAKANNVKYCFKTSTKNVQTEEQKISIFVTNQSHLNFKNINSDVKTTEIVYNDRPKYLQNKDGLDYMYKCRNLYEDNFLRRVYRAVQSVTESISN